jgi:BirA family biotin operon repressor/biotin-[acetyl-CoA-carboxylase] ligase
VEWSAETGSTNDDALLRARRGEAAGLVLVADHQTAGRGRLGRRWEAPPGTSLLCTVLLRPPAGRRPSNLSTLAMAVAAAEAAVATTGGAVRPSLKWPNDVLVGQRKLAGVAAVAEPGAVAVGLGLNVDWPAPDRLPAHLAPVVAALSHHVQPPPERRSVLQSVLAGLDRWCGSPDLLDRYRGLCSTLGQNVRVDVGARTIEGVADDVDGEGHLLVDGCAVAAGDVVHLRPAGG